MHLVRSLKGAIFIDELDLVCFTPNFYKVFAPRMVALIEKQFLECQKPLLGF